MVANLSIENDLLRNEILLLKIGFTKEGLNSLYKKINICGANLLENAWKIAEKINSHVEQGGVITTRVLNRFIEDVIPGANAADRQELRSIITNDTKYGKDIEKDYYSGLPSGLADEMRKWHI